MKKDVLLSPPPNSNSDLNTLYYGDCFEIMNDWPDGFIDLIYLDPPFNSNRSYNAIYKTETGMPLPEQVEAFCDIWELNEDREKAIRNLPVLMHENGIDDSVAKFLEEWMKSLRHTNPKLLAYLSYMTERLIIMRRKLKPTGSIYYHCDTTASHYVKVIMDGIFGHGNFLNEIVWHYATGGASKRWYAKKHDSLLLYVKDAESEYVFNPDKSMMPRTPEVLRRLKTGKPSATRATNTEKLPVDVWTDINALNAMAKERLGYPTQKPKDLLKRIVDVSSNENAIVLDPFCGCATTIAAAHELGRKWIGIDIAYHAIRRVVQARLLDVYNMHEGKDYVVGGIPRTLESAKDLWKRDKYQFQRWAVEMVSGFVSIKKSADGGIDGKIYFENPNDRKSLSTMVIEVKGGMNVGISAVRDLRGALERSGAEMAGLIIQPDIGDQRIKNFEAEMLQAGFFETAHHSYRRMQLLTVQDILDGKKFDTPYVEGSGGRQKNIKF